jgi:hypothetical protein
VGGLPTEISTNLGVSVSRTATMRITKPMNVQEGIRYCKCLREHFWGYDDVKACNGTDCHHMSKKGPIWVLEKLGRNVPEKSKMDVIRHILTTSGDLFSS